MLGEGPTTPNGISIAISQDEQQICNDEYDRFLFYVTNGFSDYVDTVDTNFRYYRGPYGGHGSVNRRGGHWSDEDRDHMEKVLKRECHETNRIFQPIETMVGEQIFTRADITFKPRKGGSSEKTAKALSQLAMHVQQDTGYHRKEKTIWRDGLIKQRGFFDIRMKFDDNLNGDVEVTTVNPKTVMPDLYAESYDPKEWKEVITFGWLSLDEIQGKYGKEARDKAEKNHGWYSDNPFTDEFKRASLVNQHYGFGKVGFGQMYDRIEAGERRLRVIERQFWKWSVSLCFVDPVTGDYQIVPEHIKEKEAEAKAAELGCSLAKFNIKKVWWRVVTRFAVLHDTWSPYRSFTIIPFFYIFDYGTTICPIDNAIGPQDLENRALSAGMHVLKTTANSGYYVEKDSLTNMTTEDLAQKGSQTGVVIEYGEGKKHPEKIPQTQFPQGLEFLMSKGESSVKEVMGVQDADKMLRSHMPGDSTQSAMWQSKLAMADPLDNLEHTRALVGMKYLELWQDFFTIERVGKITTSDEYGKPKEENFAINQVQPDGSILNDITIGEYDVVVSTKPTASSWLQTQFNEIKALRELKVNIPDDEMIRRSSLDNKYELADRIGQPKDDGGAAQAQNSLIAAKVKKMLADATAQEAKAITAKIQAIYGATHAAQILAQVPGAAPLADELLLSSGFTDAQIPEPISNPGDIAAVPEQENTHPNYPPKATAGIDTGIQTGATI
jgi:hypothetical protein